MNTMTISRCDCCGSKTIYGDTAIIENNLLCGDCLRSIAFSCDYCGEWFFNEDNAGDDDTPVCESCFDEHYHTCEMCGKAVYEDDVYRYSEIYLCPDCYHSTILEECQGVISKHEFDILYAGGYGDTEIEKMVYDKDYLLYCIEKAKYCIA